ncbi:MAG: cytochrome-c peroxidase [Bacteroidetes bacterium]|nr:cytochrome-c peroxidase [Bacteroidota bacterium]
MSPIRVAACILVLTLAAAALSCNDTQTSSVMSRSMGPVPALGRRLFFDPILSADRRISCSSCHRPQFAFADTSAVSIGVFGRKGTRNAPSVMNVDQQPHFFWDGRAATLEQQALMPIANPMEMDLPVDLAIERLRSDSFYIHAFRSVFQRNPDSAGLATALAAFQRMLETSDTPFDEWKINDAKLNDSAKRGYALFNGKAGCVRCHFGTNFNNVEFRNIGLYDGKKLIDSGRAAITHDPRDLGKFKIGPLRNIALTAPYMHNGMFRSLREVIDYYNDPDKVVSKPVGRDVFLSQPLHLNEAEKGDLEAFLRSLTSRSLIE